MAHGLSGATAFSLFDQGGAGAANPETIAIPPEKLLALFQPLTKMLSVAVPQSQALRAIAQAMPPTPLRTVCEVMADRTDRGVSLADALDAFPRTFTPMITATVRVGADSGQLGPACGQVCVMLEKNSKLRKALVKASIYPIVTLLMMVGVFVFNLLFLTPKLSAFYAHVPADRLPGVTRVLMSLSEGYRAHVWLITLLVGGATVAGIAWLRSYHGRMAALRTTMLLPPVRNLTARVTGLRYLQHLTDMTRAGRTNMDASELAAAAVDLVELRGRYAQIGTRLEQGWSLSEAIAESQLFDPTVTVYIRAGELAGELTPMLAAAAAQEEDVVTTQLNHLIELMPTALIVITGFMVGVLMLANWSGIFALQRIQF